MSEGSTSLRVTQRLSLEDVAWVKVLDVLGARYKMSFRRADDALRDFFKRFLRPFNLYWHLNPRLTQLDNSIFGAICEVHGADVVSLWRERVFRFGALRLTYKQTLTASPWLSRPSRGSGRGTCEALMTVGALGREFALRRAWQVALFQTLLFGLGVASYVVCVGLLLYGIAVFVQFLRNPVEVALFATRNASVGLALLCFLIGSAGLFGRAVSNLRRLAYVSFRRRRTMKQQAENGAVATPS